MLPAPGLVTGCETNFPQGIRFDNCLYKGLNVTPDFDPMVGKLVAKGIIREVAIRKMRAALDGLLIEGLKTNVPLHKVIMNEESFIQGKYSTAYIGTVRPQDKVVLDMDFTSIYKKIAGVEARRMGL
jgi:acetyl-CoA carboxylase biotin carboxylase subunit